MKQAFLDEIYQAFTKLRTAKEAEALLGDLLTPHELKTVAERWQLVKQLAKGTPHRKISSDLGISIAKVTRGSKAWRNSKGGFKKFFA